MNYYARIQAGRVAELIPPLKRDIDAPEFIPQLVDPDDPDSGMTEQPADWPTFKAGDEVPIEERFHADIVATLVNITGVPGVSVGDTYSNGVFAPYVPPLPSPAEILANNTAARDALLVTASARIAPLQDAVDLDEATAKEVAALKLWKQYRVAVNRVDLTLAEPVWPDVPA